MHDSICLRDVLDKLSVVSKYMWMEELSVYVFRKPCACVTLPEPLEGILPQLAGLITSFNGVLDDKATSFLD